jgi:hypothetical protein
MVTVDDVRHVALNLPGTTEHLIRDRVKFRVKQLVYVAFSRDETVMGFAFPKEQRSALIESEPGKFLLPPVADLRYHWVEVTLTATRLAPGPGRVDAEACSISRVAVCRTGSTPGGSPTGSSRCW